jgi:hypothetical protein
MFGVYEVVLVNVPLFVVLLFVVLLVKGIASMSDIVVPPSILQNIIISTFRKNRKIKLNDVSDLKYFTQAEIFCKILVSLKANLLASLKMFFLILFYVIFVEEYLIEHESFESDEFTFLFIIMIS